MKNAPPVIEIDLGSLAQWGLGGFAMLVLIVLGTLLFRPPTNPEEVPAGAFLLVTARPTVVPTPTIERSDFSFIVTPTPGGTPEPMATLIPITPPAVVYPPARGRSGFHVGGQVIDFGQNATDKMTYAGLRWVKFQVTEGDSDVADKINQARSRGFRVLISIMGNPARVEDPAYHAQFAQFAGTVAAAGADAIEIWNEPNIARDWPAGKIDPGLYIEILRPSYQAIKAVNPNVIVISAGLAPTLVSESLRTSNFWTEVDYTTQFVADGGLNYIDCMGIHYNITVSPPTWRDDARTGDAAFFFLPQLLEHYARVTRNTRPVCITEYGILTDEGYAPLAEVAPDFGWAAQNTLQDQGEWLAQAIQLSAANPQVEMIIIWNVDFWHYGADPHAGYAIIRKDGGCPTCEHLRRVLIGGQ